MIDKQCSVAFSPLLRAPMARATVQVGDNDIDVVATGELAVQLASLASGKAVSIVGNMRMHKHTTEIDIESMVAL